MGRDESGDPVGRRRAFLHSNDTFKHVEYYFREHAFANEPHLRILPSSLNGGGLDSELL